MMRCGDALRLRGHEEPGRSGCLVRFAEFPDHALLLTAGHVVLSPGAKPGHQIDDARTGEAIGTLFSWTMIDGDPTADAALVWIDPSKVDPRLGGLQVPRGFNLTPSVGDQVMIVPRSGQQIPRVARIESLDDDVDVLVEGPDWPAAKEVTYSGQIRTDALISEGGDSGSIVLDAAGRVVGMVVAGSAEAGTIITPIEAILQNAAWGGLRLELVERLDGSFIAPPADLIAGLAPAHAVAVEQAPEPEFPAASPEQFVRLLEPAASASMRDFGVPARFTVTQAALESGWGKSRLAIEGLNLFGVKADASWNGPVVTMNTREFIAGQWVIVPARWRKYDRLQDCLNDHAMFFHQNPRYAACFNTETSEDFARAVAAAGYATDPNYAEKLLATMLHHGIPDIGGS
jgi:hypothetical protein